MEYFTTPTYYYKFKGEVNTEHVLRVAIRRAQDLNVKSLIFASETGRSALKALRIMRELGVKLRLIVVTHPPDRTWGPKGDIPIGLNHPRYRKVKERLEKEGIFIVQGTRPFASAARSFDWERMVPDALVYKLLGGIFGQGVKMAIEAALMATDAGAVSRGDIVVSLGGTFKGLDAAIVCKTTYSYYFLQEFEVLEIIAKPWKPRVRYPEHEDPEWRGDLDQYYREPL